jgi:hypothetical protein
MCESNFLRSAENAKAKDLLKEIQKHNPPNI